MTTTVTEAPTNAELADWAFAALESAGVPPTSALRIAELLPPRGHFELTAVLIDDPGALSWLAALWTHRFAARFRTFSDGDAAEIQRLLAKAAQR